MHGCISTSVLVVNAEIGSMGGVVEGGVGIANKTSPGRAALEKVQAEIRQEYDVREERKRELEFLEKGGNPLDFTFGTAASVTIRSTSFTDQHPDLFVTSEAKGSIAFTVSTHGDSVESSGRPGVPPCEPSSADNLLLFDAEHDPSEGDRNSFHPSRSNVVPSDQSARVDGSHKARELGDSAAFGLPRKAYKRRYRSRPNRDGTRSSSTDVDPTRGSHISSLPSHHGPRDVKGLISDAENLNTSSSCNSKHTSPIDGAFQKNVLGQQDMELDGVRAVESIRDMTGSVSVDAASDATGSENALGKQLHKQSLSSAKKNSVQLDANGPEEIHVKPSSIIKGQPSLTAIKVENQSNLSRMNGFSSKKGNGMTNIAHNSSASRGIKNLDSESSCAETNVSVGVDNDIGMYSEKGNSNLNGNNRNKTLGDASLIIEGGEIVNENKETEAIHCSASVKESVSQVENGFAVQPDKELIRSGSALKNEVKDQITAEGMEDCGLAGSESEREAVNPSGDSPAPQNGISCTVRHQDYLDTTISDLPEAGMFTKACAVPHETPTSGSSWKLGIDVDEDSILREAEIIEAKRKRIMELSLATCPTEIRRKSHWDYVLEEIAWLANDFAQERIWKVTAAAQLCYRAAFACQLTAQGKSSGIAVKKVSRTLAKAVMEFWHSVEERHKELEQQNQKDGTLSVQAYAVRFLKYNSSNMSQTHADVPLTPDRISDSGVLDLSWEDNSTEEDLFYSIRPGAFVTYRKSVESHLDLCKRIGSSAQEEVETSACGAVSGNAYDEYEGETSTYDRSVAFEGIKSSRFSQKKRKHLAHGYGSRSYEVGSELLPMEYDENKFVTQQSSLLAKPPGSSRHVSIPTKRMRTASRRVISPFNAGTSGFIQLPNKTDASSGDTNSLQDDLSTLGGGSLVPNGMEVESIGDFEKQFPLDFEEVSRKPKKKKKARHLNVEYKPRWQVDSSFQHEQFQRDHLKKRSEIHQLESNGSSGLFGQPMTKRPKIMRQSQDNSFDNITPFGGSIPSPVASQMSNMSNPNKFIKMLGGRDRGRKTKPLKMLAGQPSSGSPWSLFEDQALVVLVHDMGPNWELVSDALNSTLRFKCIFRKAKECKERHNSLMDRTSGDGADSAEDSGSSQPYPSTLPGIPKGSARQLFQRLQGPMEEDTLKSHFEKIIVIGQRQHYRKTQDPKQLEQLHSSHTIALSQVCPNNLNGVSILTPLELCDATSLGADMLSFGYQGPQSSGVALPNQGAANPTLPSSGASSAQQGSPNMMLGNNFSSSPASLNSSVRDGRYVVPKSASLSADEQQRMQQYNQIISGRNMPQSNIASPGALPGTDRGVRILPGGNGMGMVSGIKRSMPMARPGLPGIASSSMVNSGSMVSPGIRPAMHSGQGSSMLRPRESLHMIRDSQRQMMVPDLQNSQGVSHFGGLSSPFPNQTASPPVSSYPVHHQPPLPISPQPPQVRPHHAHFQGPSDHAPTPQQQAYAIRLAKERHLQHRFLQQQQSQQQQQFAMSNSLMPHAQSQPQLPISTPMQNSSQVQAQTSSPPASLSPLTPTSSMNSIPQHKHPTPTQGIVRNSQAGGSGLTNQTGKQRQRQQQQFSQANRQHPQQRQQSQAQLQAKVAKGAGRGNLVMQQNIPVDPSLLNGVSTNPGYSCLEKGESATHLIQNQGYSALHAGPSRQYVPAQSSNQSLSQQKMYSGQASSSSSSSKHLHQLGTQSNHSNQGHVSPAAPGLSAVNQSVPSSTIAVNHQREPSEQKSANLNQPATQRVVQANRQINTNPSDKQQVGDSNADQHPTSRSSEMDTMGTLPRGAKTGGNGAEVVSVANVNQWQAPEQLLDSNASSSAANLSPLVFTSSNMNEPLPQAGQGPGRRPSPSGVIPSRHDTSAQWQQQPSQVPQTHSPVPQPEQHQEQQTLQMPHSHQQAQPVQAGNGSMFGRPSDPRLE